MKQYREKIFENKIRKLYRQILTTNKNSVSGQKEIHQNSHLIRSCCYSILNVQKEYCESPKGEGSSPLFVEEIQDFCEISSYRLTEESITEFLRKLSLARNLSYSEIACLIPEMEHCCLRALRENSQKKSETVSKIIRSLYVLNSYECSFLAETLSTTENVLKQDEVYPHLEEESKQFYREKLQIYSKKHQITERETAVELLKKARKEKSQLGELLLSKRNNRWYFPILGSVCVFLFVALYLIFSDVSLTILSIIPIFISGKLLCDTLFSRLIRPEILPKIKIKKENCPATLVTIVSMISNKDEGKKLLHRLDVLSHRITIPAIRLGLLLDLPASQEEISQKDQELLTFLEREIQQRNKKENRYFCAIRKRMWSEESYNYQAYGRKQGAMMDFSTLDENSKKKFALLTGPINGEYMITLDADTEPALGAVESLIGFMEHPNHKPRVIVDPNGHSRVIAGYGIATPRIEANPETSFRTPFSAMLSGNSGTEFYKNPHFNLYQDLFSQGIFCGKGIVRLSLYRDLIAKRFSKTPILSHDLPEGEILRCANLSDIVFFDEIPDSVLSDEKRNHRWIRGDFQNTIFLSTKKNRSNLFRFKIIHNLSRAIFPLSCFLLIASSVVLGFRGIILGIFWIIFPLLLRIPSFFSAWLGPARRYRPLREFSDAIHETTLNIFLLPARAYNGVDGAIRGIIRTLRGKKKLEWTTAAASSNGGTELNDYYYQLRWQLIGFPFLFSPYTILIGALWLSAPIIARLVSAPYPKESVVGDEFMEELRCMWRYYEDFMDEKHHWLAPDNYQQEPLNLVAARTSPTNIGFGLLSVLGAFDLGFIGEEELCLRVKNTLNTIKNLPKWNGHLYNWYDTETLKVLSPRFISTVDCGNFAAALHTLSKGLSEQGTECRMELVEIIEQLLSKMDFSVLYDKKKKKFPIGYYEEEEKYTSSYYDLYASEARLTSYYALMKGQIPPEHWAQLARPIGNKNGNLILSSWSGTMFEYFMPHLFLPAYRRTLSGESLRGILSAQMQYVDPRIPWGISESGYYTFDQSGNYQYRAFGIPAAALRRDVHFPSVIAPYATLLAYPWFPKQAEENRKKLPKGKYGFYEAIDFRSGPENPRVVQSYMAHHVGMSFLSGINVVKDKIMQKRFISGEGEAFLSLLTEKIPAYSKHYFPSQTPDKEEKCPGETRIDSPDPENPKVRILTNGKLTEVLTDSGCGFLRKPSQDLTRYSDDTQSPCGIFTLVRNKGTFYGTTYAPLYSDWDYKMFFDGNGAVCYGSFATFETRLSITMHPEIPVSIREVTVKNNQMTENDFDVFFYAEPTILSRKEYESHPEYKDLFITAHYNAAQNILYFCRNDREKGESWISVTASKPFCFQVSKDRIQPPFHLLNEASEEIKHPIFPAVFLQCKINLRGRGTESVKFYFSTGNSQEETLKYLQNALSQEIDTIQRRYCQYFDALCLNANIRSADRLIFDRIAQKILYAPIQPAKNYKVLNELPVRTLWQYGISADHPIVTVRIGNDTVARVLPFIKSIFLMNFAGIECDLILLYREDEGYNTPVKTALNSLLSEVDPSLQRQIFLLNIRTVEEYLLIQKCSSLFVNLERSWKWNKPNRTFRPIQTEGSPVGEQKYMIPLGRGGYTYHNSFFVSKQGRRPYRPWSIVLSNHRFGTIVSESGLGYTFGKNASEHPITPRNTKGRPWCSELLYAVAQGKRYDLLANASAEFFQNRVRYRLELLGCIVQTEVAVLPHFPAKIIKVTLTGNLEHVSEIVYQPKIRLGKDLPDTVTRFTEEGKIFFHNGGNYFYGREYCILYGNNVTPQNGALIFQPKSDVREASFILSSASGINSARQLSDLLSSEQRLKKELSRLETTDKRYLILDTPDKELNAFVNGFLQQQILHSRILGRTGPSQPGGAYGFRDQLQDSVCLSLFDPSYLKRQILRCCAHQFEEGDVLHWWHPRPYHPDDGIKTRFSDDPFWLVFACSEYFKVTGNKKFFEKKIPYLKSSPLSKDEYDRYFSPTPSEEKESIYHHCLRALRYGLKVGERNLILIGSGDWNDGMNRIENGAETVWGSMFAVICLEAFFPLIKSMGTKEEFIEFSGCIQSLRNALNQTSFSNGRFLRGFRKDGTPFGEAESIDLIPQAFGKFSGLEEIKVKSALDIAYQKLWNRQQKIIRLLSPAYSPSSDGFPGSIAEYPPGIRENGGQYTHAGIWFARALLQSGEVERGWEILSGINPIQHCNTVQNTERYGREPFVIAADVYTLPGREGMGGWSHYTGAAGWYLKTVAEDLLGIRRTDDTVSIQPNLPKDWNGYRATVKIEKDTLEILVERGTDTGTFEDGKKVPYVSLRGTNHAISVIISG